MNSNRILWRAFFVAMAVLSTIGISGQALAAAESAVFDFNGTDGAFIYSSLISDGTNLYGTANATIPAYLGIVFELSPPASGKEPWKETILYSFTGGSGGYNPYAGLVRDSKGNLYGTAAYGGYRDGSLCSGGCGTVFELSPPSERGASWTETTLYQFKGSTDGAGPMGSLIFDPAGNLYGTTQNGGDEYVCCGTAFELSPPSAEGGDWSETVLHDFAGGSDGENPVAALYRDAKGNLYGTTQFGGAASGNGTIFRLSPTSGGTWTEDILHSFALSTDGGTPFDPLIEHDGAFYGTAALGGNLDDCYELGITVGCGTVFKLVVGPGGEVNFSVLYAFEGSTDGWFPKAGVVFHASGNLYGGTLYGGDLSKKGCITPYYAGCGVVFELSPQTGGAWKETVLHTFELSDGYEPRATLLLSHDNLWGTTVQGGGSSTCPLGCGGVFELVP